MTCTLFVSKEGEGMKSSNYVVIQGWMCNELGLKGNELLIYALIYGFSQDGESAFHGSREYIANTFNISKPTVDKALNNLLSADLIIKYESCDFNTPNAYSVNVEVVKKLYWGSKETLLGGSKETLLNKSSNSNTNNTDRNNSKELFLDETEADDTFLGSVSKTKEKPKKKNLYQKCMDMINDFTDDAQFRDLLTTYLKYRLEIKDKPLYANMWKGMLRSLDGLCGDDDALGCEIVQQSINRGYLGFFKVNRYSATPSFDHTKHVEHGEDYEQRQSEWLEEMKKDGKRTEF